jgi:hypothetical protein
MAEQTFFDFTNVSPVAPSPIDPGKEPPIDLQPSIEEQRKQWEASLTRAREEFFKKWKKNREDQEIDTPYDTYEHLRKISRKKFRLATREYKYHEAPKQKILSTDIKDFEKAWNTEQRKRVKKLDPIFRKVEMEMGGARSGLEFSAYGDPVTYGAGDAFTIGLMRSASLGALQPTDPIYGESFAENFSKAHFTGNLIGEIIALKSIGAFLGSVGIAAKLANLIKKHKTLARIVRFTGQVPAAMKAEGKIYRGLSGFARSFQGGRYGIKTLFQPVPAAFAHRSRVVDME